MKQKQLVTIFLIITISFVLFLPILNLSFAYKDQKINVKYFSKKQLFSTDNLESILNYFAYKIFHFSLDKPQVIVGKDKFLFLGNGYVSIIDKTTGDFFYTSEQIDSWTTKLKQLQEWYEKGGIEFIFIVAPNKHTIYNDKLPDSVVYKEGKTITDDIVKSALDKNIHILNLKKILRTKKEERQLYFNTDTHWNHYGALIGYETTMQYLNTIYNKQYKTPKYNIREIKSSGGGDLTRFFKINHFLSDSYEDDYNIMFKQKNEMCYGKIDNKTYKLGKCTPKTKNTFNQYIINKNAVNKEKLLYLCDSFGMKNTDLYYATFSTVWREHLGYINGVNLANFIKEQKPDVVIYQIVERNLGSNFTVADMP